MTTTTGLISVDEAQRIVLERAKRLDPERVPIERAAGRVLAEPVAALVDLPPFASSAMDGYALRAADTADPPTRLPIIARIAAGSPADRPLAPGEAMAISTGGAVPEGADAVVPLELVEESDEALDVPQPVAPGANIRDRGGDVSAGDIVLEPGARLGPAQVAALAAAGVSEVQCTKRPRVGILVTGSELRQPGEPLGPGQIYESNGLLLATALQLAGAVPAQLGVVADEADEHERAMERALLGFDMLITSGGASVGPHDLVRATQAKLRVEELFWGVSV
jgi:molybdopterin molybdotransferase